MKMKRWGKWLLTSTLAVSVLNPLQAFAESSNEVITKGEFSQLLIETAQQAGVGAPEWIEDSSPLTREDAAAMMYPLLNIGETGEPFTDVPDDHEYAGEIGAVYQSGVMLGYSEETFGFGDQLTREQVDILLPKLYETIKPFELLEATIMDIQAAMDAGKITSKELVQMYIDRIEEYDDQGPSINAIITVNPAAVEIAEALDKEREEKGPRSLLHGIPVIVKDNYDTADMETTAGCLCLDDSLPPDDAFQIKKLKEAGAIILAKSNLSEFAFSFLTNSSMGGQTLNPYDLTRYPGGSSGGTAAALAANFGVAGLGTDTGGSIRLPSTLNSLVGIRPTIGLTSRDGIIPLALTQDVGGPMARTVEDAAIILDAISGYDPSDIVTARSVGEIPVSYTDYLDKDGLNGARIGVIRDLFGTEPEHEAVNSVIDTAIADMEKLGATVMDVEVPHLEEILQYPSLSSWEFKFQLNDYLASLGEDAPYQTLEEIIASEQFDPSIESSLVSRNERETLEDAEYQDIVLNRTKLTQESLLKVMADYDLDALIYPSSTNTAAKIGENQSAGSNNRLSPFSGFPAVTVPAGYTADENLPVGIEFLGRAFSEPVLIKLAYAYEQGTLHRVAPQTTS
ncbi:amidase family protein [Marinicrinis lubricantis]|uniref:Amidase family protein n=1 Tax=Marinicrinis lubricantis TaxID=2086470 RepID=A0ABW1IS00_9BACL